ncbi:MAG: bifunctional UDP-N-acetylglucosamine diphosphorylase/glucosamine-1-phosphate N-acetyltransferase GlmU [Pseudomonadales bacterium]
MKVDVIVLAAGQGTRMRSTMPKVLHPLAGQPMLEHVINAARQLPAAQLHIVIGHGAEQVRERVHGDDIHWVEQLEQLGTGHAVQQALPGLRDDSISLVLYGDIPLIRTETLQALLAVVSDDSMGLLTAHFNDPSGYGRIVRNSGGDVSAIVEQKDASAEQLLINEVNTGFMAVPTRYMQEWLPRLSNANAQAEYYLTDVIGMAAQQGVTIATCGPDFEQEVLGVNSRQQLIALERWHQHQRAQELLLEGVAIMDPTRFDLRGELATGMDVTIDVNVVLEGRVSLGDNVTVGPNCVIQNAAIGNNVEIKANTVIEDATIGDGCVVGPFARLRPGTKLLAQAKVGNFVETKNTVLGQGSKVNHLSYVGDAEVGSGCNIGAGTITCNYDGANKFKTELGDNVFIGSNSTLVAPLTVANEGFVGAGSTVTKNVANKQLAVARGRQKNIDGWQRPRKNK